MSRALAVMTVLTLVVAVALATWAVRTVNEWQQWEPHPHVLSTAPAPTRASSLLT